jgi:hypothetical protein
MKNGQSYSTQPSCHTWQSCQMHADVDVLRNTVRYRRIVAMMEPTPGDRTMAFLIILLITLASPAWVQAQDARAVASIDSTLNELHDAAAKADGRRYFSVFSDNGVFIGTDATERWTLKQFRAYTEARFSKGQGWVYKPRSRHIVIADIPCKCMAWFDELLDSKSYGTSRGTGVLVKKNGSWKIAQYALTFPIPNDLANEMTAEIKSFEAKQK